MNKIAILDATVYTPDMCIEHGVVLISGGRIEAVGTTLDIPSPEDWVQIASSGLIVAPGFIDGQTHGGNGYDFMEATPQEVAGILRWMASTGVTGALPTIATSSLVDQIKYIDVIRRVQIESPPGAAILGIHLEGPYISQQQHGAQPTGFIRDPSKLEIDQLMRASQEQVRILTLAPELPGALDLIQYVTESGIVASIGHSAATYEQVVSAIQAGLARATHLFNAMTGLHHRQPGAVGAILTSDQVYAELILDGEHVHPAAAIVAIRAKGLERIVLVTDATQAAGLGDGVYVRPGNRKIIVKDGTARLESGSLAGSVLTLDQAVRNAVHLLGLSVPEALAIASRIPAESLGIGASKGRFLPGMDADLVLLTPDLQVLLTLVGGRLAYCSPQFPIQLYPG